MARNRNRNLVVYTIVAIGLFFLYRFAVKPDAASPASSASTKDPKLNIHLEDLLPVKEGEVPSAEVLYKNIMNERPFSPVVIFSKSYCPFSKIAKDILTESYVLNPPPRIVELDKHPQGAELQAYIAGVTGRRTVPNVLVLKESHGGGDDMIALHESGDLISSFEKWAQGHLKVTAK